ncbi:MAG: LuxR C-terminal-related transcriptional regulator [Clostridiales Family XIII bacterium]|jgi:LuxR family maltose regulon positive regulatory protein|nr:LuxR C-terminal-related transcriptional regulator [Clostridiales Family XIII bacterium]
MYPVDASFSAYNAADAATVPDRCGYFDAYFDRPRMRNILEAAVLKPVVTVCAGAGFGKTRSLYTFLKDCKERASWIQLSDKDNEESQFWEHYVSAVAETDTDFAKWLAETGFPNDSRQFAAYCAELRSKFQPHAERILALDDFHLLHNPAVLNFWEKTILSLPPAFTFIIISRREPEINLAGLIANDLVAAIDEKALCFTELELANYLKKRGVPMNSQYACDVLRDTKGWMPAVNLVSRFLTKAPVKESYARRALRMNIFKMMEHDVSMQLTEGLRHFLTRLSLIDRPESEPVDHLAADLVSDLANDGGLLPELERLDAYVRYDAYLNMYYVNHLFLDLFRERRNAISESERRGAFEKCGEWHERNGFPESAVSYYEKIGKYDKIVGILLDQPAQMPEELARRTYEVFGRAPEEVFDTVEFSAFVHVRSAMCAGMLDEAYALSKKYEGKYRAMPEGEFRNHMLGCIYYCIGVIRFMRCTEDGRYDFDEYFAKQSRCLKNYPLPESRAGQLVERHVGPWFVMVGESGAEAAGEYMQSLIRTVKYVSGSLGGAMSGEDCAAKGELMFYRNELRPAEVHLSSGLKKARANRQFETANRILLYLMRIAFLQGDAQCAGRVLDDITAQLDEEDYAHRYITRDIAQGWYYCSLQHPEKIPEWLRGGFEPYRHVCFLENFGNQVKARYCFLSKDYTPLLSYISEMKQRESVLLGRVEMLAMEACMHYQMKNKEAAYESLGAAYEAALPNGIVTPFIELGKDMRTLTAAALRNGCTLPDAWLKNINRMAATFSKRQAHMISKYNHDNGIVTGIALTDRETAVLMDLSNGFSRSEIAVCQQISINTVKAVIEMLHAKLGTVNTFDLIRVALEKKLI